MAFGARDLSFFTATSIDLPLSSSHSLTLRSFGLRLTSPHGNEEIGGVAPQLSILTVYNTLLSDSGIYTCVLLNSTAAINLVVLAPTPGMYVCMYVRMYVCIHSVQTYLGGH